MDKKCFGQFNMMNKDCEWCDYENSCYHETYDRKCVGKHDSNKKKCKKCNDAYYCFKLTD